jgi:hypothetical protein
MAVKPPRQTSRRSQAAVAEEPRFGMLVKRAEQAMIRTKSVALKLVGLTLAQYVALVELEQQPGITAATRDRIDPIEQGVFDAFSTKELAAFRAFLSRFIEAFEKA